MIVVDTSALMAVLLNEPMADACVAALEATDHLVISAGTTAEALIVADRRGLGDEMAALIEGLGFEQVAVTSTTALGVAQAYRRWGKGAHPAGLNFGDCFAYQLASSRGCRLLYVGDDFSRTDVESALLDLQAAPNG
nr:type II toxin-antitoxin system VapC family toxin [uncultured Brevundimonas sp.]